MRSLFKTAWNAMDSSGLYKVKRIQRTQNALKVIQKRPNGCYRMNCEGSFLQKRLYRDVIKLHKIKRDDQAEEVCLLEVASEVYKLKL